MLLQTIQLTMLTSTVFNILLVVGIFLAAKCQAEQPLEDANLQELQGKKDLQDEDLQELQDDELQELQEENQGESLRNPDEDPDDNLQESLPSQGESRRWFERACRRDCTGESG